MDRRRRRPRQIQTLGKHSWGFLVILHRRAAEVRSDEPSSDYWMTYSDLMANLLLVFALVLSVMMLISQSAQSKAAKQAKELEHLRTKAEEQLGIRKRIIEQIREKLKDYDVKVDPDTGAILIAAKVLFGQGRRPSHATGDGSPADGNDRIHLRASRPRRIPQVP